MTANEMFDALDVQIWTATPSGALDFVNTYTARYFGITREQLVGEGWQNVLHSSDVPVAIQRWSHSLQSGEFYEVEFRLLRGSDRSYRWHRATARKISSPSGEQWLGTNLDIDAEMRRAEMLTAWREQAAPKQKG